MPEYIYKICRRSEWEAAAALGQYQGSAADQRDGFIHFSSREQLQETAQKHFFGQADLVLVAVQPKVLGAQLKWEAARGGALFPHLYGVLPLAAVVGVEPLPLIQGQPLFPEPS
jgi:uncharacterized protein (DUF952 family)